MAYRRHPIEDIEGIGPAFAAALRDRGMHDTEDLLFGHPRHVLARVQSIPRFPVARFWEFRAHATLMQVAGITGQLADGLCRIGRNGLTRFAFSNPDDVAVGLARLHARRVIPESPGAEDVLRWQKRALAVHYAGSACGRVTGEDGTSISGAVVYVDAEVAITNERGAFWIPVAPFGRAAVVVRAEGYQRRVRQIAVTPGTTPEHRITLRPGADAEVVADESAGQSIRRIAADDSVVFRPATLASLVDGTPLTYRGRYAGGDGRFLSVHRVRRGNRIEVQRVRVDAALVPVRPRIDGVYVWANGALAPSADSRADLRRASFFLLNPPREGVVS